MSALASGNKLRWIRDNGDDLATADGFVAGRTYLARIDTAAAFVTGVHHKWNATLAGAITYESSNNPDRGDAFTRSTTAGDWCAEAALTGSSPAAAAGGTLAHIIENAAASLRAKFVCTADGTMVSLLNGKEG